MKMHHIRQLYRQKMIAPVYIPTGKQIADTLTKNLARDAFERYRTYLLEGTRGFSPEGTATLNGQETIKPKNNTKL